MARSGACTRIGMEVLVEEDVVPPVLIAPPAVIAMGWAASFLVADEQARQSSRELLADLEESQLAARTDRTLDLEVVAQVSILIDQAADEHELHGHPDRAAPVGVTSEHPAVRVTGDISDPVLLSARIEDIGVLGVMSGQRANPVGAQELVLVKHVAEYPAELVRVDKGEDPTAACPHLQRNRESRRRERVLFQKPLRLLEEERQSFPQVGRQHRGRRQRQQPDKGTDLEPYAVPVGKAQHIVVDTVVMVPEFDSRIA